jgi:hypothetical protein
MKPPLETRWIDPAVALKPDPLSSILTHIEVVNDIAEQLYPFPTPEFPHFRTIVNRPDVTQTVFTNYGHELVPDIVALEWPERVLRIVAEVATVDAMTIDYATERWWPESRLEGVAFYLYVPAGYLQLARALIREAGIKKKDVGLRSWRRIQLAGGVDIARYR